jgi:Fe-S-cluster containining protein
MNISDLYIKISVFEESLSGDFKSKLQCKKGCSRCCYVDLSVFEIEAQNIKEWFGSLSSDKQIEIKNKLQLPQEEKENFYDEKTLPCHFLRNEECLIYEARPLICRTQGNAMVFQGEKEVFMDICPLNEEALEVAENDDFLNLDIINTILVQMNREAGYSDKRVPLKDLL